MIPSSSQIIKQWIKGCRNKLAFHSFQEAQYRLPSIQAKHNKLFKIYHCPTCYKYHLATIKGLK